MNYVYQNYLEHFGIPGMKWGKRRFQNEDGTLTEAGKARYQKELDRDIKRHWVKTYNEASANFNGDIKAINQKYAGKDIDMTRGKFTKDDKAYVQEVNAAWKKRYAEAANKRFGKNPMYSQTTLSSLYAYSQFDEILKERT